MNVFEKLIKRASFVRQSVFDARTGAAHWAETRGLIGDLAEALQAAIDVAKLAERLMGWKPIATAPKDGSLVLMRFVGRRPYVTGVVYRPEYSTFVQASDYSPVAIGSATGWTLPPAGTE